jgi:cyclophilin family peptidyl-prolyl cis-trans isomerase/HEAT repeat protein
MRNVVLRASCFVRGGLVAAALLAILPSCRLAAQAEATVNRLAPILAAEDARRFDEALLRSGTEDPDTLVRRTAIRALGHIGDPAGAPLLFSVLQGPDAADLHAEAAFALGLMRDTSLVPGLVAWLQGIQRLRASAVDEGITAIARTGGPVAAAFLNDAIRDPRAVRADSQRVAQRVAVREAWRLGPLAPVPAVLGVIEDTTLTAPATYTLSRLRAKEGAAFLYSQVRAMDATVRQDAVRAFTRQYTRDAEFDPASAQAALKNALNDLDAGVRVNALRALSTYADSTLVPAVLPLLNDAATNVAVTAAAALGPLGGKGAVATLSQVAGSRRAWPLRREALLTLARLDPVAFRAALTPWANSADWRDRATAAEGVVRIAPGELAPYLGDGDARVVAVALQAWAGAVQGPAPDLLAAARTRIGHPDAMVRATAAEILARAGSGSDVPALVAAWDRGLRDSFPDAAQNALAALKAVQDGADASAVQSFLASSAAPADPLLKGWAEANWPELAERWGPSRPLNTGRSLDDYRALARKYLVDPAGRYPRVTLEVADRGSVTLELFGPDAPLTVANFLRLVDRGYFDGLRFHRVVPNFVIQAGDPRGDGSGGPGWAIRDEINRRRYGAWVLGMALSGPDTGGSQWFITLSPQPHLDGNYTVFGRLRGGDANAAKVVQGDQIRSIRR